VFPQDQRLHDTADIIASLRRGVRASLGPVTCSLLRKAGTLSRVTVIVDTKVSKKATERNLLKRRVRAILHEATLPTGDLVVRVYPQARDLPFSSLHNQVTQCLKRLSPSRGV
jgi:ribonuclease P protein component